MSVAVDTVTNVIVRRMYTYMYICQVGLVCASLSHTSETVKQENRHTWAPV